MYKEFKIPSALKKMIFISIKNAIILFTLGLIVITSSCNKKPENKEFTNNSLVAHFDYFQYEGKDDYYKQNPLPDIDYFYNPLLQGWYSDPSIGSDGENFFMVTSTFSYYPGVPLFHSKDLMNWKQVGHVLNRPEQLPLKGQKTSEGIFAPAISYNPHNKTWYMITTNIRKGNFFVKSKNPLEEWSDPVWLTDVHGIDPSFFFDEDGKAYIVYNDVPDGGSTYEGHRAIRIIQFDYEEENTIGKSIMLVNGGVNLQEKPIWIEGPHLYKINDHYLLMCAEGGTSENHSEVIFKAASPFGSFKPWKNNPILTQKHLNKNRPFPITCAGHADLVRKNDGSWWGVFLACRPINNKFENLGRETFLMPVRWTEDGYPILTDDDQTIPRIVQMKGIQRDTTIPSGNFKKTDNFNSPDLGLEWMSLRGSAEAYYSLTEDKGYLNLKCANVDSRELETPAYLGRRLQHHKFECSTQLYFSPQNDSTSAGILIYKDEAHQYYFSIGFKEGEKVVQLTKIKTEEKEVLASRPLLKGNKPIQLKVLSDGLTYNFMYATDKNNWEELAGNIDAFYLSTASSFGFTGTSIGMYATSTR